MEWKKSPQELVDLINSKLAGRNCDYRKMFGYPAYFVNGNKFAGLFEDKLFLRLSDADIIEITKTYKDAEAFEPIAGRKMKNYLVLPKTLYCNSEEFSRWLDKSMLYAAMLPPKEAKKKN